MTREQNLKKPQLQESSHQKAQSKGKNQRKEPKTLYQYLSQETYDSRVTNVLGGRKECQ